MFVITDTLENHYVRKCPLYISLGAKSDKSKVNCVYKTEKRQVGDFSHLSTEPLLYRFYKAYALRRLWPVRNYPYSETPVLHSRSTSSIKFRDAYLLFNETTPEFCAARLKEKG